MRAAHGLAITLVVGIGALAGASRWLDGPRGSEDPTRPDRGQLSQLATHPPRPEPVARIPGGTGPVQDLAASGGLLAILCSGQWFLSDGGGLRGGFGDRSPGSPAWLARPVSIALGGGRVYVLDAGRHALTVWDTTGARLQDISLSPAASDLLTQPLQVMVGPGGVPVVLSFHLGRDGLARWEAVSHAEAEPSRMVFALPSSSPSALFDRPLLAGDGLDLLVVGALDHSVSRVEGGAGEPIPRLERAAPPLWRIPASFRRRYAGVLHRLGRGPTGAVSVLPEFWPSVRDVTVRPDGSFLLAISAGEERQHVELLDPAGIPVLRLSRDGFREPVHLDGGRVFLVRETLDHTEIHELAVRRE